MEINYTELAKAKLLEMGLKGLANHTSIPKMMGEICSELVKNCNTPAAVSGSVEPVREGTVCHSCKSDIADEFIPKRYCPECGVEWQTGR
jgi:hypothetical protein